MPNFTNDDLNSMTDSLITDVSSGIQEVEVSPTGHRIRKMNAAARKQIIDELSDDLETEQSGAFFKVKFRNAT